MNEIYCKILFLVPSCFANVPLGQTTQISCCCMGVWKIAQLSIGVRHGWDHKHVVINLRNYHISFWNWDINIENYCITFLPFSPVEESSLENIESIQFDTNYQWYLFEISQNYIIACFSSQFVLKTISNWQFCTQNNIKLNIF